MIILQSIDWQFLIGIVCFELVCLWLIWVGDEPGALPDPDERCVVRGEPRHYVQPVEWKAGDGRVRNP